MKRRIKIAVSCLCILLATATVLGFAQALVMPKYMSVSKEGALISEYYNETTAHDVLFVGDCEVYECFTPPTLWEKHGITSYIRGSAQQLVWQSYYLLEEMLERETPRVVVYNVYALKYGEPQREEFNRMTLDGMEWSDSKIAAIKASMTEDETFLSYVFPLLRFHSRWDELGSEDFTYLFDRDIISHNGYLMQTDVLPKTVDIPPEYLKNATLPQTSMDYLEKMRQLCAERGVELVLIKAPTNHWKYYWYDEWDAQVNAYAQEHGLAYYNFIPMADEIGIDWSSDTYDRGGHLNVYGAEKLTDYFGAILKENHGVASRRGDGALEAVWSEKVTSYFNERNKQK